MLGLGYSALATLPVPVVMAWPTTSPTVVPTASPVPTALVSLAPTALAASPSPHPWVTLSPTPLPTPSFTLPPAALMRRNSSSFSTDEASGAIDVATLPSRVTLWLDGVYLGLTPLLLEALPPGHHVITLIKAGWKMQEFSLELSPGATIVTSRQLREAKGESGSKRFGSVVIHGRVEPGTLQVDGVAIHPKPNTSFVLPAGAHTVSARLAGHPLRREFTVFPDTANMLVLDAHPPDSLGALVAPLERLLPRSALSLAHGKIVIRAYGHLVVGHLQDPLLRIDGVLVTLNSPPVLIGRSLYLPVTILERLCHRTRGQ